MTVVGIPPSKPGKRYPSWPRLAREASAIADRLRPALERPRTGPVEWRRRAASFGTAARNYRANRVLARQGREDLRPLYFIWTTHRACNFLCDYCDDHRGARYPELPLAGSLDTAGGKQLLRIMRTGTPSVYFSGGEPTLRKDLPELVREAHRLAYYPIVINTNGSALDRLLPKPAYRSFLADLDIMVVSLDALDLDVLSRMWKYERPEEVLRNLLVVHELAREMNLKLMVNTVIQPGHVDDARAVLDFACDLGIWFCPVPHNLGPRVDPALLEDPEYASLVDTILERKRKGARIAGSLRMNQRLLRNASLDCRNTLKPHVDHDGRLAWPCKASADIAPTWLDVLQFKDVETLYDHARQLVDPAGFQQRCGAACGWAQNYTTDEYAHGLASPFGLVSAVSGFLSRT